MDPNKSIAPVIENISEYPIPYVWFILILVIAVGFYVLIEYGSNLSNIQTNWPEYRCQPHIMPFAGVFGHDINENFQFCIQQIIQENVKGVAGPFAQGMGGFTGVLSNLMKSANSFRTMLATLVGGVVKIISEFKTRMTALMSRIKITSSRMKAMMFRVYGTMFAVMYMGMSAQTGIANFGDSFIFKFIDTFCFPPEQAIILHNGSVIPIVSVAVGDTLKGGHHVETIYKFMADGQSMVKLDTITVSSNHFVKYNKKWIMAKDHPDAEAVEPWSGGSKRPLICLTTHDHKIPIDKYIFADYDETSEGDVSTRKWVDSCLNGRKHKILEHPEESYEVGSPSTTKILTLTGFKELNTIELGDMITSRAKVVGIQVSQTSEFCRLPDGQHIAKGTLLWSPLKGEWLRAYTMYPSVILAKPVDIIALFVSPGAQYTLDGGHIVRDAMEIYSPETKRAYAEALLNE